METRHAGSDLRASAGRGTDAPVRTRLHGRSNDTTRASAGTGRLPTLDTAPEPTLDESLATEHLSVAEAESAELSSLSLIERVEAAVGSATFDRYFRGKVRLELDGDIMRVVVGTQFIAELLARRCGAALRAAATEFVAGTGPGAREWEGRSVAVRFVVEESPGATDDGAGVQTLPASGPVRGPGAARISSLVGATVSGPEVDTGTRRWRGIPTWARFEDFSVGEANRLAWSASLRLAEEKTGTTGGPVGVSPLFLHGACGMGKTHLLQAAARRFREVNPGAVVRVVSGEAFTNEFITAVRANACDAFRKSYRRVDLLCVDDVHFLASKQATQAELLHTFDAISQSGARVMLASDEHPRAIKRFSEALVSRFLAGMVAKLEAPEPELRVKILHVLAARRGLVLDPAAAGAISGYAGSAQASIRDLEGMLSRVDAAWRLLPEARSAGSHAVGTLAVEMALGRRSGGVSASASVRKPVRIDRIIETVLRMTGIDMAQLRGRSRHHRIVLARTLAAYLARKLTSMSFPEIARALGRPNHSTVITACQRFAQQLEADGPANLDGELHAATIREVCARAEAAVLGN